MLLNLSETATVFLIDEGFQWEMQPFEHILTKLPKIYDDYEQQARKCRILSAQSEVIYRVFV